MYNPKTDYVVLAHPEAYTRGVYEPTTEDPFCVCGWPKHHHGMGPEGGGTGPLASGLTDESPCRGFRAVPLTAVQADRSQELLRVMRDSIRVSSPSSPSIIRAK